MSEEPQLSQRQIIEAFSVLTTVISQLTRNLEAKGAINKAAFVADLQELAEEILEDDEDNFGCHLVEILIGDLSDEGGADEGADEEETGEEQSEDEEQ